MNCCVLRVNVRVVFYADMKNTFLGSRVELNSASFAFPHHHIFAVMSTRLKWKRKSASKISPLKHNINTNKAEWIRKKRKQKEVADKATDNVKWAKKKSKKELRVKDMRQFFNFFQSKSHTKKEMQSAPTMIDNILTQIPDQDVRIMLNLDTVSNTFKKEYGIYSKPPRFCALSHCIFNIVKTYKFAKDIDYQTWLMNQWMEIIKILVKYEADFFQCINCREHLDIYYQYHRCSERYHVSSKNSMHRSFRGRRRVDLTVSGQKLHNTAFKQLCVFFREDLNNANHPAAMPKKGSFWWLDANINERIDNVHECLYKLLGYILKIYDAKLPLLRLQMSVIAMGPTPGYCDYEHIMHVYHSCLPVFPSYKILNNLLSVPGVVPFTFIHTPDKGTLVAELDDDELFGRFLAKYHGSFMDDIPKNWIVSLLFTYQQVFAETVSDAIEICIGDYIHRDIVYTIVGFSYDDKYDKYFDEKILSNYDYVHQAIEMMRKYNMDNITPQKYDSDDNKYDNQYETERNISSSKYIPFKHRTTNSVVNSWTHAFNHPSFKNPGIKPCILSLDALETKRREIISKLKPTIYNVNLMEERFKFEGLIELLCESGRNHWVVVCENSDTVEQVLRGLTEIESDRENALGEQIGRWYEMVNDDYWCRPTMFYRRGIVGTYMQHISQWRVGTRAALLLYDLPLNIDELLKQIAGYGLVVAFTTDKEQTDQLTLYNDHYGIDVVDLPSNFNHLMDVRYQY